MPDTQELSNQSERVVFCVTPAFYRIADVMLLTALSRATIYRRIADGRFPAPIHLRGRACGWTPAELQAWIDNPAEYRAAPASAEPRQARLRRNVRRLNRSRLSRRKFRTQIGHDGENTPTKDKAPTARIP